MCTTIVGYRAESKRFDTRLGRRARFALRERPRVRSTSISHEGVVLGLIDVVAGTVAAVSLVYLAYAMLHPDDL